jgi:hypothetical protein
MKKRRFFLGEMVQISEWVRIAWGTNHRAQHKNESAMEIFTNHFMINKESFQSLKSDQTGFTTWARSKNNRKTTFMKSQ